MKFEKHTTNLNENLKNKNKNLFRKKLKINNWKTPCNTFTFTLVSTNSRGDNLKCNFNHKYWIIRCQSLFISSVISVSVHQCRNVNSMMFAVVQMSIHVHDAEVDGVVVMLLSVDADVVEVVVLYLVPPDSALAYWCPGTGWIYIWLMGQLESIEEKSSYSLISISSLLSVSSG